MAYNTKNLKDLEYSIYALQSKASNINEQIKKYSKSLELKSEKKNKKINSSDVRETREAQRVFSVFMWMIGRKVCFQYVIANQPTKSMPAF